MASFAAMLLGVWTGCVVRFVMRTALVSEAFSYLRLMVHGRVTVRARRAQASAAYLSWWNKRRSQGCVAAETCLMLEILVIGLEAGLTIDNCLALFAAHGDGRLAAEMRRLLAGIRVGKSRRMVLLQAVEGAGEHRLKAVLLSLYQAHKSGSAVSGTAMRLLVQARLGMRAEARQLMLKAPIKMLFPLVGLILPSLMLVLLAPAALGVLAGSPAGH